MSMPLSSACKPFVLEIISGRLPCAASGRATAAFGEAVPPKSLPVPAAALPASEVRKNFRRDQSFIGMPSTVCGRNYTVEHRQREVESGCTRVPQSRAAGEAEKAPKNCKNSLMITGAFEFAVGILIVGFLTSAKITLRNGFAGKRRHFYAKRIPLRSMGCLCADLPLAHHFRHALASLPSSAPVI